MNRLMMPNRIKPIGCAVTADLARHEREENARVREEDGFNDWLELHSIEDVLSEEDRNDVLAALLQGGVQYEMRWMSPKEYLDRLLVKAWEKYKQQSREVN
jgi:hypothetical protein